MADTMLYLGILNSGRKTATLSTFNYEQCHPILFFKKGVMDYSNTCFNNVTFYFLNIFLGILICIVIASQNIIHNLLHIITTLLFLALFLHFVRR